MKRVAIILILVAAVVIAIIVIKRWNEGKNGQGIRVSGNIELTQVNIAFKVPGRVVERSVDEGATIKAGTVIARLDQEQLLHQRDKVRATLESAESRLAQMETAIQLSSATVAGQVEQRQAELNGANANLRDLLAGSRSQEIEQAQAAVDRARSERERADSDWKRAQALYKNEDISSSDYDAAKTRFETAVALMKSAEEYLALVREGPRKEMIEAARAQVARSQAALRLAEAGNLDVKRQRQELESRRADLEGARAELASIETQLKDMVVTSPIDGVVLVKSVEPGEIISAGTSVVTVGDIEHPWLRAYVGETDLGKVKLGMLVKVTTDSYQGKIYWGKVSFISSDAEFTPKQIQTSEERVKQVYRIKIDIPNTDRELKSNMPADAVLVFE